MTSTRSTISSHGQWYFVWLLRHGTALPQLWHGDQTTGTGQFQHKLVSEGGDILAFHPIPWSEAAGLSLADLAKKFPAPPIPPI